MTTKTKTQLNPAQQLLRAHRIAKRVAETRSTLPILAAYVIQDGSLYATDLETSVQIEIPEIVCPEPVCFDPGALETLLTLNTKVVITRVPNTDDVCINGTVVTGWPMAEYPSLSPRYEANINNPIGPRFPIPDRWKDLLPAMGEESRVDTHGVYIDLSAGEISATDGHRLHMLTIDPTKGCPNARGLVPAKAAALIPLFQREVPTDLRAQLCVSATAVEAHKAETAKRQKLKDKNPVWPLRPDFLRIKGIGVTVWFRLGDREFPDYHQIMRSPNAGRTLELDRNGLCAFVAAVAKKTPRRPISSLVFHNRYDDKCHLSARVNGATVMTEVLSIGADEIFSVQVHFLNDVLTACKKNPCNTISVNLVDGNQEPIVITDGAFSAYIQQTSLPSADMEEQRKQIWKAREVAEIDRLGVAFAASTVAA